MRTIVVGNRKMATYLVRRMLEVGWTVVGYVAPAGNLARAQANYTPVEDLLAGTEVDLHRTADINDEETKTWLRAHEPDVCVCPAWSQIIDSGVLSIPTDGFVGFHSSKLPRGRGGAPVNWRLIEGADEIWLSIFRYTSEIDAGTVLEQRSVSIEPRDDVPTVWEKLSTTACDIVEDIREPLESGTITEREQSLAEATYRPRRQPQDGLVDWTASVRAIDDWVRALAKPYPGAFTFHDGAKLVVWEGRPVSRSSDGAQPGDVIGIAENGIDVATGNGTYRLTRVQYDSRPEAWGDDFATRVGLTDSTEFGRSQAPRDWLYTGIRGPEGGYDYDTNVARGETGELTLLVQSPNRSCNVSAQISFGEARTEFVDLSGQGTTTTTVSYDPTERGTTTVTVRFQDDDGVVDVRYLKVFAPE